MPTWRIFSRWVAGAERTARAGLSLLRAGPHYPLIWRGLARNCRIALIPEPENNLPASRVNLMPDQTLPPRPASREGKTSLWRHLALFRDDILSSQPEKLYRAWMAEFRTPFFHSFLCNDPDLVALVLHERADDFPKSNLVRRGLAPLLGQSVMVTNGETWRRQRRILDPAFEGGRIEETFPAMLAAGQEAAMRLKAGVQDIQPFSGELALDVILRTSFSINPDNARAAHILRRFRNFMATRPIMRLGALLPLPQWLPRRRDRRGEEAARDVRAHIAALIAARRAEIAAGTAPRDLATAILTTSDPETGTMLGDEEMVDQIATFILAGHETTAASLAWMLYLLASHPDIQARAAEEARAFCARPSLAQMEALPFLRDIYRESLRLYPPVPMIVREAAQEEQFRGRRVPKGAQVTISPWHLQRHERLWDAPHEFDPDRWQRPEARRCAQLAYQPFSSGPRVCIGAAMARIEGPLLLALLLDAWEFAPDGPPPVPMAHLTLRGREGIRLSLAPRA